MAIKDALLPEFDHETGATRRLIERVPDADLGWRPHEKSYTMGQLAEHIAGIPRWVALTCNHAAIDIDTVAEADRRPQQPESTASIIATLDASVAEARRALAEQTDGALMAPWTFRQGGREIFTMPRASVLRSFIMNHMIHHRGQLTVYLRLRNVPLPSLYGPTADEP
jgi:uncharacterized damage-inducible protein DinB